MIGARRVGPSGDAQSYFGKLNFNDIWARF